MKSYETLLFIASLAVGLVLMALFFPPQGLSLPGGTVLRFPSLSEVLATPDNPEEETAEEDTLPELSPEEIMEQRMAALHAARDSEFVAAIAQNPARFFMPQEDVTYLDTFFLRLEEAQQHPLRILHYGDSQLEGDRMTDVLREWFQSNFSGSGSGMVPPMQTLGSATVTVATRPSLPYYMYFGSPEFHADHRRYGPLAQMAIVADSALFTITQHGGSAYPHCRSFRRIGALVSGQGSVMVPLGDDTLRLSSSHGDDYTGLRLCSALLPSSVSRVSVLVRGSMEVYALMADGSTGVSVDNIAMRGASGTHFTSLDYSTFAPFFRLQQVGLIILQYGGNSVPYLKTRERISEYKQQVEAQIAYLKRVSPRSRILFIGPTDMATTDDGEMKTYPFLPQVVDSLRAAALESGAAFWDMYRAMGGRGSMARWVEVGLAGDDYVHFTLQGSRKMSELLCRTFDFYYRYYRFRHGLDAVEMPEDTLTHDTAHTSPAPRAAK